MATATQETTPTRRAAPKASTKPASATAKAGNDKSSGKAADAAPAAAAASPAATNGSQSAANGSAKSGNGGAKSATASKVVQAKPAARSAKPAKSGTANSQAAKPIAEKATPAKAAASAKPAAAKPAAAKTADRAAKPGNRQSRDSSMTGKEHDEHVERIWTLAKRIGIAMFVTWDGENQRARPLAATVEKEEGAIYFLTDVNGEKDEQISEFPIVSVTFADHKHSKFVALSGKATISNDRAKIKQLWSPFAKAWWDGPEDPAIRVIKVIPQDAELWDSPGRIVTTISMLTAAVTGRSPKIGENAKVVL